MKSIISHISNIYETLSTLQLFELLNDDFTLTLEEVESFVVYITFAMAFVIALPFFILQVLNCVKDIESLL